MTKSPDDVPEAVSGVDVPYVDEQFITDNNFIWRYAKAIPAATVEASDERIVDFKFGGEDGDALTAVFMTANSE